MHLSYCIYYAPIGHANGMEKASFARIVGIAIVTIAVTKHYLSDPKPRQASAGLRSQKYDESSKFRAKESILCYNIGPEAIVALRCSKTFYNHREIG